MTIVNIDASEHLVRKVGKVGAIEFVLDVIRSIESRYYMNMEAHLDRPHSFSDTQSLSLPLLPIWQLEFPEGYENISHFLHTTPIYLRDFIPEGKPNEQCIIDTLGAYYSNQKGNSPYIELYLTAIDNASKNKDEHFKWLFTKVLLHELGHATLDIFNYEYYKNAIIKVGYNTPFGKWREESMANAIALKVIKESGYKKFYTYAKRFMRTQPAEYALGVLMENIGYWDLRSVMDGKEDGVNLTLQKEWLNYAQGRPTAKGLQKWNEILSSKYVYAYGGRYYTDEAKLIDAILKTELTAYQKKHGHKMAYSTFSSIFPYIKTGAEMSYELSKKVKGDSRFKPINGLSDAVSLYYYWNHDTLHEFIANINVKMQEYQNY